MSCFTYSSVGGQGVLTVNAFTLPLTVGTPTASVANPVLQGTTTTLSAGVAGGTSPYTYQWQTDGGSGGTLTNIPGANSATYSANTTGMTLGVNYSYSLVVTDSVLATATSAPVVVGVYTIISGTLAGNGNVTPTPGAADISQLNEASGYQSSDGLNYYTDNGWNNNKYCGETFTTGSNSNGYALTSLAIGLEGGSAGGQASGTTYDLFIYKISANGLTATLIADVTNLMASTFAYPNWAVWNFSGVTLNSNTVYGYGFGRRSVGGYIGMATSSYGAYSGGQIAAFPANGGAVVYGNSGYGDNNHDGTFDIGLIPNTPGIILNPPTAAPNPAYALSPVQLMDTVLTGVPISYQWLTGNGSGGYIPVSGATSTNLTVYPLDLNPGGANYVTNYYMVATDATANSVTSSAIALTIHAATVPLITGPTPANVVTFVGDSRSYTVTENGTLPILTNQWQFNNGGGYVSLTGQTNTTLTLSNLQTTDSGNYQIVASNVVGSASNSVTLTVNPAPAAPVASNQMYYNAVYTNHPWAYWRLNETNDPTAPGAPVYTAYDYSGHGFDAVYGNQVTVAQTGPQLPTYPNMDANELAVDTLSATPNSWLTPPALNLTGNSNVTFMTWIYPAGTAATYTGLLMNRGGPDNGCGFGFTTTADHLGYTWNNNSYSTYSWDSGLAVAENQWNFVAYVITPTNAVVYLGNLVGGTNFLVSTHTLNHIPQTFAGGTVRLGGDSSGVNNTFNGLITEASLFTNALTSAQVQQYFLIAIGAQALAPTVPDMTVTPAAAAGAGVYSGQNVRLSSMPTGTAPLSLQWQAGPDGSTWTNVPNATNTDLLINPLTVGAIHYQLLVTNAAGAVSNTPVTITFNALPAYPAGLWTANFQETNNIGAGQNTGGGVGHYVGRGILGNGLYWNILPFVLVSGHGYDASTVSSTSGLMDDGATSSGISCQMATCGVYNSLGGSLANSSDIGNLLDQFAQTYYSPRTLQFFSVPDGTYNLTCYAGNGVAGNYGSTFVVHDSHNGDQTNSTTEATQTTDALAEGVNFVTFTNVHVVGGTLNVDVFTNQVAGDVPTIEGAQIQLLSYDPPVAAFTGTPTNGAAPLTVTFANSSTGSTNWLWNFGDGNTFNTAGNTNVSHVYAVAGSYTVSLTAVGPLGTNSTTNTAYIVVTNAVVISSDASLSYLTLSPLGALTPTFNTTLTNYTATNAIGTTSVTVTVTNTSALATNALFLNGVLQGSPAAGSLAGTVAVAVGSGNVIQVVVTAQDGVTTSTNTVTVTVLPSTNAYLTSLVLNPAGQAGLTTSFVSTTLSYLATNAYGYTPTFTVVNADLTATNSLIYNNITNGLASGVASTTPTLNLTLGVTNVAQVQVTAQDGVTVQTYQVNIVEQPSQTVPHLTNSVSGNNLVLSWPGDHLGYRLLVQTNNLNKGVSGNIGDWGTVPGSTNLTGTSITILKTGVTNMYYKLVYP
jgi:PKD repeat protein